MKAWLVVGAFCVAVLNFGQPALAAEEAGAVVEVRGPKLTLYSDQDLKHDVATKTKAEILTLIEQGPDVVALPVAGNPKAWKIVLGGEHYWVKKSQVRLERKTSYKVNCDQRLAGVSVGASRGIGGSCK